MEYCRNCGKRNIGMPVFALPGVCMDCHLLPSIGYRYNTATGECIDPIPAHAPAQKHDGKLDARGSYEVSYWPTGKPSHIYIEENDNFRDELEYVHITPAQALSLLIWLKQEEPTLQRLAKEKAQ